MMGQASTAIMLTRVWALHNWVFDEQQHHNLGYIVVQHESDQCIYVMYVWLHCGALTNVLLPRFCVGLSDIIFDCDNTQAPMESMWRRLPREHISG
jgi:hypothetical protein